MQHVSSGEACVVMSIMCTVLSQQHHVYTELHQPHLAVHSMDVSFT